MNKPPKALLAAIDRMEQLPGIAGVFSEVRLQIFHHEPMRRDDWAYITSSGWLYVNPQRQATAAEWVYILSHCCLHLALGHIRKEKQGDVLWERACDCVIARFLLASKIGKPPAQFAELPPINAKEEEAFYDVLLAKRHAVRLSADGAGLAAALFRRSAMVDPKGASRCG